MSMNLNTLILLASLGCCAELCSMNRFTRIRSTSESSSEKGLVEEAPSPRGLEAEAPSPFFIAAPEPRPSCCCRLLDRYYRIQGRADEELAYGYSLGGAADVPPPLDQQDRAYLRYLRDPENVSAVQRAEFAAKRRRKVCCLRTEAVFGAAVPIALGVHWAVKFFTQHQKTD